MWALYFFLFAFLFTIAAAERAIEPALLFFFIAAMSVYFWIQEEERERTCEYDDNTPRTPVSHIIPQASRYEPLPLPPPVPVPDYQDEIAYWRNEARRFEAEMQARAKEAEKEEFERWLEDRRYGE